MTLDILLYAKEDFFLENYVYIRFCVCLRSMPGTKSYHGWFINRSINVLKAYTSYNVHKTPGSSYRALSNFFSLFHNNINISSTFLRNTIDNLIYFSRSLSFLYSELLGCAAILFPPFLLFLQLKWQQLEDIEIEN